MPRVRMMTEEEIGAIQSKPTRRGPSRRELIRQEYKAFLGQFEPGAWVHVDLEEDEKRPTVKNRLKRAAEDLGWKLAFKRTEKEVLRFEIITRDD